jgi:hypothetical protein
MIEVAIKVQADDITLTEKFLLNEEGLSLSHEDPVLSKMVKDVLDKFKSINQPDILIKIKYTW